QRQAEDVVTVASKFKQRYECRLPPAAIRPLPDPQEEAQLYNGSGVAELLRPMAAAPCLLKTKDWWTYEFCYGKHIQQYHVEESEIKGDILFLGYYHSAFDWDDETAKASKQHRLKRYHSQSYVNGSRCDLTGRAREAEVWFLCEEGAGDYIARVDEPQSCSYVLTVHTTRICHHPFLRPPAGATPQPILCQPALTPAQYVQYVRAQVSVTAEVFHNPISFPQVEELSPKAASSLAVGESPLGGKGWPPCVPYGGGGAPLSLSLGTLTLLVAPHLADPQKKIHFKVIRNPEDLLQFLEELKESTKKGRHTCSRELSQEVSLFLQAKEKASEEEAVKAPPDPPVSEEPPAVGEKEEEEEEEEEDRDLLGGLEKELESVLLPREGMAQLKEEVKTEMEKEFDNIINEVEDELETEGLKGEFDRNQASKSLASTLNRLMDKLDAGGHGGGQKEEEERAARRKGSPAPPHSDRRVRVRVSRMGGRREQQRDAPPPGQEGPPRQETPPQLQHMESEVRELLAKEGLRAEGKIEIKIVTAGGGEEEEARWLSEEDTKNLKEIFFNILIQGTEEAQKERQRQQALEDNYRFVWGGVREEPPPPGDSEDPDF
ncbi:OS9 protein, partial [Nycticryphes semicollaris]|nr:OS9 protein [Nycticryphes semicollaris]